MRLRRNGVDAILERMDARFERMEERMDARFERMETRMEANLAAAAERDRVMLERFARSEDRVIEVVDDMHSELRRNSEKIDDHSAAIRANTEAVLRILDRWGPEPA